MKCRKLSLLLLIFTLLSCQSNLQKAGQSHALTFKKWQALSEYASASYLSNHPSLYIVGELTVDSSGQDKKFILTNIKLSDTETKFQINLLHPQFESKYICTPQCLQLSEYLWQNAEGNTMLTRYFEQHEFALFKLYGEMFSLDAKIQENKAMAPEYFNHDINWVINQQSSSRDMNTFILYLRRIFSEQAYVSFMSQPQQLYSHLIQSADEGGQDASGSEAAIWSDTTASETGVWSNATEFETVLWGNAAASETLLWSNATTEDGDLILEFNQFKNAAEQQRQDIRKLNIELGDLVCSSTNNEFGSVREIRGKNILVELVGKILSFSDGVSVATKPSDVFNTNIVKNYTPVDKLIKTYNKDQLSKCHLE
jgi:hypothetical protein